MNHASYYDSQLQYDYGKNVKSCFQQLQQEDSDQDQGSQWYMNQNGFVKANNQQNHSQQEEQDQANNQSLKPAQYSFVNSKPKPKMKIKSLSSPVKPEIIKKKKKKNEQNTENLQKQSSTTKNTLKLKKKKKENPNTNTKISHQHVQQQQAKNKKKKKIQLNSSQLQKSNVSIKSHQSNQFLVLGQDLYDYEQMKKISNKGYKNNNNKNNFSQKNTQQNVCSKSQVRKIADSRNYPYYHNLSASNYNNEDQESFYSISRFNKKLNLTVKKIKKYLLGFLESQYYEEIEQEYLETQRLHSLSIHRKLELYHTLLQDQNLRQELENQIKVKQDNEIKDILQLSINEIQERCQRMLEQYPGQNKLISKWKNSKMHQLNTAKQFLMNTFKQANSQNDQLIQQSELEKSPLVILQKQLQIILSQDFYPQLKQQTLLLKQSLQKHLSNDHYPQHFQHEAEVSHRLVKVQQTQNYFTPNGVLFFFQKFTEFLQNNINFIDQMIQRGNYAYGLSADAKKVMSKIDIDNWYDFIEVQQKIQPIISEQIYVTFQKEIIGSGQTEIQKQNRPYMHIFNKAITDAINEQFQKFMPFYPNGQPISYLQKPSKFLQFIPQTFDFIFQKCKYTVYSESIIMLAGLIVSPQQNNYQIHKYNKKKQQQMIRLDITSNIQKYNSLMSVGKLIVLDQLFSQIYEQVIEQCVWQIGNIDQK